MLHIVFPAQAKLASFACFDVEQSELRVFDSKVDRAASEATRRGWPEWHSRTWGFGFCYVYTRALALAHPYDAAWHMGEDYSFLLQASKRGAACVAFTDDDAADPAVLHVLHQGSTAQTPTRPRHTPRASHACNIPTSRPRADAVERLVEQAQQPLQLAPNRRYESSTRGAPWTRL